MTGSASQIFFVVTPDTLNYVFRNGFNLFALHLYYLTINVSPKTALSFAIISLWATGCSAS